MLLPSGRWSPAWIAISGRPQLLSSLLRCGSSPQSCSRCHGPLRGHRIVASIAYGECRSRSWQRSSLRSGLSAWLLRSQRRATFFPERLGSASRRSRSCQGLFSRRTLWPCADVALFYVSVSASVVGLAIGGRLLARGDAAPPPGWIAVNTHFGDVSQPFQDFPAAQFIQQKAAETSARVLIFPESVVPRWSESTEAFWRQSLDRCRTRGQILAIGAGLPAKAPAERNVLEGLRDLKAYDFGAAIDALKGHGYAARHPRECNLERPNQATPGTHRQHDADCRRGIGEVLPTSAGSSRHVEAFQQNQCALFVLIPLAFSQSITSAPRC